VKYAVMATPISPRPWTESVEDSAEDADALKKKIESLNLRGIYITIEPIEEVVDEAKKFVSEKL